MYGAGYCAGLCYGNDRMLIQLVLECASNEQRDFDFPHLICHIVGKLLTVKSYSKFTLPMLKI